MELYNHQKRFLEQSPDIALLVHGLGSGKTRTSIEWAKLRPTTPLIICPKGLKENWRRECEKWGLEHYEIISKEQFKKDVKKFNYKIIIVDEADHFYSPLFKSQLSKALKYYVKQHNPHRLFLTGTPYRSSAWNVYSAIYFLGKELPFQQFKFDHFQEVRMGFRTIPIPRKDSPEKVRKLLKKYADIFNPEDEFDIPPQISETIYTKESTCQLKAHKDNMEILPIVRFTRDHQIESGIGCPPSSDNKLDIILQMAKDNNKMIVVCRYKEQLETYSKALKADGNNVFEIHGDIQNRSEVLDNVEFEEKCVLLIQSATCEGYEAPSINLMVFASMDYSYRNFQQIRGRILRMNNLHKNTYVYLLAGKCDEAIAESMERKEDFDVLKWINK